MNNRKNNKTKNLYDFDIEDKEKKKTHKHIKKQKKIKDSSNPTNDNEIIIGVTMCPENEVKNKGRRSKTTKNLKSKKTRRDKLIKMKKTPQR